jgi:hypothetical protein
MQTRKLVRLIFTLAAAILFASTSLWADIRLVPVVSSGLTSPVFVGHAGDGRALHTGGIRRS